MKKNPLLWKDNKQHTHHRQQITDVTKDISNEIQVCAYSQSKLLQEEEPFYYLMPHEWAY